MKVLFTFSRPKAFKLAWTVFWMATGTSRVGVLVENGDLIIMGKDEIDKVLTP